MATTFGDNIRRYREMRGMTQQELAEAIGYKTKGAVNKIENNVTRLPQPKIKLCADALGVPVTKLFADAEPANDPFESVRRFLPYLAQAEEYQLKAIEDILKMPKTEKNDGQSMKMAK